MNKNLQYSELIAWKWAFDRTDTRDVTLLSRNNFKFFNRWARRILDFAWEDKNNLDWYWFLNTYFEEQLGESIKLPAQENDEV